MTKIFIDGVEFDGDAVLTSRVIAPPPDPVDCVLGEWVYSEWVAGEWGPCVDGLRWRTETRSWTREIITPPANGGLECGPTSGTEVREVSEPCVVEPPPVPQGHLVAKIVNIQNGVMTANTPVSVVFSAINWTDGYVDMFIDGLDVYPDGTPIARALPGNFTLTFDPLKLEDHAVHMLEARATSPTRAIGLDKGVCVLLKREPYPALPPMQLNQTDASYLYFHTPQSGDEGNSYTRNGVPPFKLASPTLTIKWRYQQDGGKPIVTAARSRLTVNLVPVTDWLEPATRTTNGGPVSEWETTYTFPLCVDSPHLLMAQMESLAIDCKPIEVTWGPPPAAGLPQKPWVYADVYDMHFNNSNPNLEPFQVNYAGKRPKHRGISLPKPRLTPWNTILSAENLVATPLATCTKTGWPRRYNQTDEGWVHVAESQLYQYWNLDNPNMPQYGGYVGHSAHGHAWGGVATPQGGAFCFRTQGAFFYLHVDGLTTLLVGQEIDPEKTPHYPKKPEDFVQRGVFLDGVPSLNEPWGVDWDWRDEPTRDPAKVRSHWRNFYVANSFNHCISHIDITKAFLKGGEAEVRTVIGSKTGQRGYLDGTFEDCLLDQPWKPVFSKTEPGVLYFTERGNHAIRKADFNTRMVTTVFRTAQPDAYPYMDKPGSTTVEFGTVHQAGANGVARAYYLESMVIDSKGDAIVASRFGGVDGNIFRVNLTTGEVGPSIFDFPRDANGRDIEMIISDGTIGPLDAIYGTRWGDGFTLVPDNTVTGNQGYRKEGALGVRASSALTQPGTMGGLAVSSHVLYPSGIVGGYGFVIKFGTGNESAYRFTERPSDYPAFNNASYTRGHDFYNKYFGMVHGIAGMDLLEGNGFHEWRPVLNANEEEFKAWLRAGAGMPNSVPITDAEMNDLLYYIRWPDIFHPSVVAS